jgi:lipopolysaccharide biosynthesis regulator YciM
LKFFPNVKTAVAVLALGGFFGARAELTRWAEGISAGNRMEAVFFRNVLLPSGIVPVRRPPKETRPELTKLIGSTPNDAELYSLRALEDEQQLNFTAAEDDWRKCADIAADKGAARLALADFYHRRLRSRDEFNVLIAASFEPAPASEKLLPPPAQRPWKTFQRSIDLVGEARLDPLLAVGQYSQWIARYPSETGLYRNFFAFTMAHARYEIASDVISAYKKAVPGDVEFPIEATAEIAAKSTSAARALEVYDHSFKPLWPDSLVKQYFDLLKQSNSLRAYLEKARAAVVANPTDLASAARIFHYWRQQGNSGAAERALAEFRQRKESKRSAWTAEELSTLAQLYEASHNYDESARNYYALYNVGGNDDKVAATALGSLARLILSAPEQAIRLGSGNLTMYRDVATMDPHPGFLNGALSLLLNTSEPAAQYKQEEMNAGPYFRRAKAAELVALFESRFPNSPERPDLRERVIEGYSVYGASDAVIRTGVKFLSDFPNASNRTAVALRVADAYARTNQSAREFALYDTLLVELAKRADGMPLGALPPPKPPPSENQDNKTPAQYDALRSPDYARVLDRYVARLVSLKRTRDALAIYRREIDRNPADPGLYDTLAAFLEQNDMGAEIEAVYKRAIAQFQDHSWQHKLARWYLRQKRQADVARLTRDVVKVFSGTELDEYFREIVSPAQPVGPALYLQLNLYAHQRFPHYLAFARNLLTAYSSGPTTDMAAYEAVLRRHWYDADDLRMRFFERLSKTGRLDAELSVVRTSNPAAYSGKWEDAMNQSPVAVRLLAEGEAWRGHYENAAPLFLAMEASFPADHTLGARTASVYRSLGTIDPKLTDTAVGVEEKLAQADPRDRRTLTSIGEIEAERDHFDKARAAWDRIPEIEPARPDGYLEAATVFWDYYRYEDALRWIEEGRKRFKQDSLFAYEAGAIRENQRNFDRAIREYAKGAIAQPGSNSEQRLLLLARRPALKPQIEQLTTSLVSDRNPQPGMFQLRVALLRNQNRRDDLERFLLNAASRTNSLEVLAQIESTARVDGFPKAQLASIEKQIALMSDPVEKVRLRLVLARFEEGQGQAAQGAAVVDALYRENPAILGVVRAAVDYHWRNKDSRRAVDILEEASSRSSAAYRSPFLVEAALKATDAGDYTRARIMVGYLQVFEQPYKAEYIALKADTYARQGDDRGLRTFYETTIRSLSGATTIPAQQRTERIAAIRASLIPVLTRVKDYSAAVDQYIEILNRFPEDDALAREAALYAQQYGVAKKLHDFYAKTAADSPKDYRWPMVLARIETQMEDYPAAISSYTRAAVVRPDRVDLIKERLNLEERLLRFEEAAASAQKLYDLTYRNPAWMEKLAELRARQGRTPDAVTALNRAWIDGRADSAANYLTVARKLESWGMLPEARKYAEEALKRAPEDSVKIWARILARQQQYDAVFAKLPTLKAATSAQVAQTVAAVAATYSADDKTKFAASIEKQPLRISLAESAGLTDFELKWRLASAMARPGTAASNQSIERIAAVEKSQLRLDELAAQLEAYDRILPPQNARHESEEEDCYRSSGNTAAELRVLKRLADRHEATGPLLERYTRLLIAQPQRLAAAIAAESDAGTVNSMLNYVMQHASSPVAQQAIAARGQKNGALWTKAYTSLTGLYFASSAAPVKSAFTAILGPMTVGARVGKPIDRDQQLAGDDWFYYGGRYGEYLGAIKQAGSEDYLPAMVEATPGRSEAYFTMAEYSGSMDDYLYALELNPARADVHDRLAVVAQKAGRSADAVREWKLALAALSQMMDRSRVPQKFWPDLSDTLRHIGEAHQLPAVRDDVEKILRTYIRRNGSFQIEEILESAFIASGDPAAGLNWIAELSRAAADPVQFLDALVDRSWVPDAHKNILYRQIVESAETRVAQSFGEQQFTAQNLLWTSETHWVAFLLTRRDVPTALQTAATMLAEARKQKIREAEVVELEVRLAVRTRTLVAQLSKYRDPLPLDQLRNAANTLSEEGEAVSARRVLEFIYLSQMKAGNLDQATFLGLAEVRIEDNDMAGAMALLRRMVLISGEPFTGLDSAAALLERTHHPAGAVELLVTLIKAEPWNRDAQRRLAEAQGTAPKTANPWDTLPAAAPAKEKALLAIIAADPRPTAPRVLLFHAAMDNRHDALALAVARQLLPQFFREDSEYTEWVARSFLPAFGNAERASIARGMADAEQRLGDPRAAFLYASIAQFIAPSDAGRRTLNVLRAQIEAEAKNETRRPMINDGVEQDRLVRPKVGAL